MKTIPPQNYWIFMALDLNNLKQSFQRLLPLVDDLADALGVLLLISLLVIGWIFFYLFQLQHFCWDTLVVRILSERRIRTEILLPGRFFQMSILVYHQHIR